MTHRGSSSEQRCGVELSDDQLADILHRLLVVGVPPSALSKAFGLPVADLKQLQSKVRVEMYGTDELMEAMTYLIWDAYNVTLSLLHEGTPASRMRMASIVLSRSMSIAGRQPPESLDAMRDELYRIAQASAGEEPDLEPGEFVLRP
jgi:hypothetical protein